MLTPLVFKDSTGIDTIWVNLDALPAKTKNPIVPKPMVFFNIDSAIVHQSIWGKINPEEVETKVQTEYKTYFQTTPAANKTGRIINSSLPFFDLSFSGILLLLVFVFITLLYKTSNQKINFFLSGMFNHIRFKEYFSQETIQFYPNTLLFYLLQSILVGGVLHRILLSQYSFYSNIHYWQLGLLVILCYFLVPIIRNATLLLIGNIFQIRNDIQKHIYINYLTHTLLFFVCIPFAIYYSLNIVIPYIPVEIIFYVCIGVVLMYQFFKLIQNVQIKTVGSIIYIFLYFCTLELIPLILVAKIVSIVT